MWNIIFVIKSNTRFWTKKKVIRDNWWLDRDYKEKINLLYHDYVFSSFLEDYVFIFFCFFFSYFFFFLYLPIFLIIIFLFAIFRQREYYFWINKRNPSFFTTIRPLVFLSKQGHPLALHLRKIKKENSFLFFFFSWENSCFVPEKSLFSFFLSSWWTGLAEKGFLSIYVSTSHYGILNHLILERKKKNIQLWLFSVRPSLQHRTWAETLS